MKVHFWINTDKTGSKCSGTFDIDDAALEGLSDTERAELIEEAARDTAFNYIDWGYEITEGDADDN